MDCNDAQPSPFKSTTINKLKTLVGIPGFFLCFFSKNKASLLFPNRRFMKISKKFLTNPFPVKSLIVVLVPFSAVATFKTLTPRAFYFVTSL